MTLLPNSQLDEVIQRSLKALERLNGSKILITGATGFLGVWLLSVLSRATELNILKVQVVCLSRDPNRFINRYQKLNDTLKINWLEGDIRNYSGKDIAANFVVHGATTSAAETFSGQSNLEKYSTIVDGTQNILKHSINSSLDSFLYLSSGAVYSSQSNLFSAPIPEGMSTVINPFATQFTLGNSKAAAECLLGIYQEQNPEINFKVCRIFSVLGPELPLDIHYAVGNFIRDSILGGPIRMKSHGSAVRSYLYVTDTIAWLLNALIFGPTGFAFHVGSSEKFTILELAQKVATLTGSEILFDFESQAETSPASHYYVPENTRTKSMLEVEEWTSLGESLVRTIDYVRNS